MNNMTEMVFILDRSGSMAGMESDTVGGFNSMLRKQREEAGTAYVTTYLFNHETEVLHDREDLGNVTMMTEKDYRVGGSTALLDAVGTAIDHIKEVHKYIRKEDVPDHTVFIITTDGFENSSHMYSGGKVKGMIEAQKELGWEFLFLGANIDAVETAKEFGIDERHAVKYCCDEKGTNLNYQCCSAALSDIRGGHGLPVGWKEDIEEYLEEAEGRRGRRKRRTKNA